PSHQLPRDEGRRSRDHEADRPGGVQSGVLPLRGQGLRLAGALRRRPRRAGRRVRGVPWRTGEMRGPGLTASLPKLFAPMFVRGLRLHNRIAMCAMNDNLAFPDGYPTQHEIDYYAARAAGGVGLIITGNAFIDEDVSKISATQIGAHDNRMIPGLARLVEAVHIHGTAIVMQLA